MTVPVVADAAAMAPSLQSTPSCLTFNSWLLPTVLDFNRARRPCWLPPTNFLPGGWPSHFHLEIGFYFVVFQFGRCIQNEPKPDTARNQRDKNKTKSKCNSTKNNRVGKKQNKSKPQISIQSESSDAELKPRIKHKNTKTPKPKTKKTLSSKSSQVWWSSLIRITIYAHMHHLWLRHGDNGESKSHYRSNSLFNPFYRRQRIREVSLFVDDVLQLLAQSRPSHFRL